MSDNLRIWSAVDKTDPSITKKANVKGNNITAICPQHQIKVATKLWGPYGTAWGFKTVSLCADLMPVGLVTFKGLFYYPDGEFEILSSVGIYKDNAQTKVDDDFAKKVETDALTKALSKLGFNADVFLGKFDDNKYVQERVKEEAEANAPPPPSDEDNQFCAALLSGVDACASPDSLGLWAKEHKEQISTLPAALQDKVRAAYKAKLNQLEGNEDA